MPTVEYTESSFELHEPDEWYPGVIASVEDGDDYGFGPTVKLILHLDGEIDPISDEPRETWAMASLKLSPRSKLYGWVKAIDESVIPTEGGSVDLAVLEGREVDAMFEHAESENGTRDRVVKIRARKGGAMSRKASKAAKPKPQPKPEVEDDDPF